MLRWHLFQEGESLVEAVASAILAQAERAIDARDEFLMVLAGGDTPRRIYRELCSADAAWGAWQVFFGDERCLAVGDAGRNDTMAAEQWLDHVPIPRANIHTIPAELGPEHAARRYGRVLADFAEFDLTMLGLGEDGHTASLFPGHRLGAEQGANDVLAVRGAPKPPAERVSLSACRLSRSRGVYLIVLGRAKCEAVGYIRSAADIPVNHVRPECGIDIYLDGEAAGTL